MHAMVFDIDGTILQSASVDDALYREAVQTVLGNVQFRPSLTDYTCVSDSGILQEVLADNAIEHDASLTEAIKLHFVDALKSHFAAHGPFPEVPGAMSMLSHLYHSPSHSVAFATGGWHASASLKLETTGFSDFAFPLATSDDALDRTEIMRIALAHLGDSFDSITYYGDGRWDQEASRKLGWNFVAVGPALSGLDSYPIPPDIK